MMYELLEELIPRSSVDTVFLSQVGLAISLALNFLLARKQRLGSTELSIETHNPDIIQKGEKPKLQQEKESLSDRLVVSRRGLIGKLQELFKREAQFDEDVREELEALLISSDVGVQTTQKLIAHLESTFANNSAVVFSQVLEALHEKVKGILAKVEPTDNPLLRLRDKVHHPKVVMMIGVNGAGKTTTSAKLAKKLSDEGKKVLLVAGDTFRAAAVAQLQEWGRRLSVPVFAGEENAKPSAVVYQALEQAIQDDTEIVLIDTAGRLHNRKNLMDEMKGMSNAVKKQLGRDADEVLLVLDGTSGQNALTQAREFNSIVPLTGTIITKLDGTPKGGVVVAIADELTIPLLYIGVGEKVTDLRIFKSEEFVDALLTESGKRSTALPHYQALVENG